MAGGTELREFAALMRSALVPGLQHDDNGIPEAGGSCLYASLLLAITLRRFGLAQPGIRGGDGALDGGAKDIDGQWHGHYWVEAVMEDGRRFVVDITADQFGHEPVRVLGAEQATAWYQAGDQRLVDAAVEEIAAELNCGDMLAA